MHTVHVQRTIINDRYKSCDFHFIPTSNERKAKDVKAIIVTKNSNRTYQKESASKYLIKT